MTAASVSAGTGVLRHYDLNDLSETAVERPSNRSRIVVVTTALVSLMSVFSPYRLRVAELRRLVDPEAVRFCAAVRPTDSSAQ